MASFTSLVTVCISCMWLVSGFEIVLDVFDEAEEDMWKIDGNSVYAQNGKHLRLASMSRYLPDDFKFSNFDLTKGIWAIFPNDTKNCALFGSAGDAESDEWDSWGNSEEHNDDYDNGQHYDDDGDRHSHHTTTRTPRSTTTKTPEPPCDMSNSASFQCVTHAQLISTVQVRYNFGGNASIRVSGGQRKRPFEVHNNNMPTSKGWEHFKVDNLEGNTITIEAIVNNTGDYVLIDKIIAQTLEPPTTPRPTRHTTTVTTETPTASPVTKGSSTATPTSATGTPSTRSPGPSPTSAPFSGQSGLVSGNLATFTYFLAAAVIIKTHFL